MLEYKKVGFQAVYPANPCFNFPVASKPSMITCFVSIQNQ